MRHFGASVLRLLASATLVLLSISLLSTSSAGALGQGGKPSAVTNVRAKVAAGVITLTWRNPKSGSFAGVEVRRVIGTKAPASIKNGTLVAKVAAPRSSLSDRGVKTNTTYSYALFAFNGTSFANAATVRVSIAAAPLEGTNILKTGFSHPDAVTSSGTDVWVANYDNSVTELNESTGAVVQVLSSASYGFDHPDAISADGTHVWVANGGQEDGTSVTEIDEANGRLVQVLSAPNYELNGPDAISSDGKNVWVANDGSLMGTVTEIDASTGALVQVLQSPTDNFVNLTAISSDGAHVWVAGYNGTITELSATTGAFVQALSDPSYGFFEPDAIISDGTNVWVVNYGAVVEFNVATGAFVQSTATINGAGDSNGVSYDGTNVWVTNTRTDWVIELSESTGALVQVLSDSSYGFDNPQSVTSDGTHVWVVNAGNGTLSELSAK
jgi:DNA-binding beta-propeller fold protein YncE